MTDYTIEEKVADSLAAIDEWNEEFLRAMKGVPLPDVKAQASAARTRMLIAWNELGAPTPDAAFWIGKAGADHYAEHLPRLREWVAELQADKST